MNIENKICGVEGTSFTGKSTLVENLTSNNWQPFGEIRLSEKQIESLRYPPRDTSESRQNLFIYLDAERDRTSRILNTSSSCNILLDRTPWTYILFEYARREKNQTNIFRESIDIIQKYSEKDLFIPTLLIGLTLGEADIFEQRKNKRGSVSISFLNEWSTNESITQALSVILEGYKQNGILINNDKSIQELVESGKTFLNSKDHANINVAISFDLLRSLN